MPKDINDFQTWFVDNQANLPNGGIIEWKTYADLILKETEMTAKANPKSKPPAVEAPTTPVFAAVTGFTFGCDPELFVLNDKGQYVSAEGLLPGTKESPYPVEGGGIQVDGMAAELTIDPASSFEQFRDRLKGVYRQCVDMLPKGYNLSCVPSVSFDPEIFDAAPEKAKELGCSPDYDAWTGACNPPPKAQDKYLRTASGHIHIGWTNDVAPSDVQHIINCRDLVKQLDWYLGGWSLKHDTDPRRRELYGKAGACRIKPYGVEYRVLSNFWLRDDELMLEMWNRLQQAIMDMSRVYMPDRAPSAYNAELITSINTSKLHSVLPREFGYPLKSVYNAY